MIFDAQGQVLALERAEIPGAWQLPQGGIEGDEAPVDALWRELSEETGLTDEQVELVAEVPEWLGYELPPGSRSEKTGRGQVHKWFVLQIRDERFSVRFDSTTEVEFRSWQWVSLTHLVDQTVAFRQPVYRRLVEVVTGLGPMI